jgi:hypothetical protein
MTSRSVKRRPSGSARSSLNGPQSSQTSLNMPEPHPAAISRAEGSLVPSTSTDSYIDAQRSDTIEGVASPANRASQSE